MDLKRIFRGWVLAILLVVIVFLFVFRLAGSSQSYKQVNTSQVIAAIQSGNVKSAILTDTGTKPVHTALAGADAVAVVTAAGEKATRAGADAGAGSSTRASCASCCSS